MGMFRGHRSWQALALSGTLILAVATPASADLTLESVAHRGDREYYDDNTVAGIASAVAKGADWVEFDVIYNPDGDTFFVSHDNGCDGPGGSATIDSDDYATVVTNCALPELDDVLTYFDDAGYSSFVIELKSTSATETSAPPRLVATIDAAGVQDDVWISSLDDDALTGIQDTGTSIPLMRVRGWTGPFDVSESWLEDTVGLGFDAANVNIGAWTESRVRYAKSLGLVTCGWAWPTADEGDNTTAIDIDLEMFMTDRLDDLHEQLGR